jgi:hypothetical protein
VADGPRSDCGYIGARRRRRLPWDRLYSAYSNAVELSDYAQESGRGGPAGERVDLVVLVEQGEVEG